jgi:RimJ/RimL family protein N-acetyltransferase
VTAGPLAHTVRLLGPGDHRVLRDHLTRGMPFDAYLRDALARGGYRGFIGAFEGKLLVGVALIRQGAVSASASTTPDAAESLVEGVARRGPWGSVVGPESSCLPLAEGLLRGAEARVHRRQRFLSVEDVASLGPAADDLRPAVRRDLDRIVPLVARYRVEDGLARRADDNLAWMRAHAEERVRGRALHVLDVEGEIAFVGAFNFRGHYGAGLGGIYTVPEYRGRGLAARGTAALARLALADGPVCTLHVAEGNTSALRCYEKAGFRDRGEFRLTFR